MDLYNSKLMIYINRLWISITQFMDPHKSIMDLLNSVADLHNSEIWISIILMDLHNSNYGFL